jgi:hypothetical protein
MPTEAYDSAERFFDSQPLVFPKPRAVRRIEGMSDRPCARAHTKTWAVQAANRIGIKPLSRPSNTAARTVATQCAPRGNHRMRRRLAIRALASPSTGPSAREVEIGRLAR